MILERKSFTTDNPKYFRMRKEALQMSFPQKSSDTSEDYWNLPREKHAELIDGAL